MSNPFHPSFGTSPPLLVGRDTLIEEFLEALQDGPGSAGRATLYTGPRGSGKTVLLNEIEASAKSQGWVVISETATPGFSDRITRQHLPRLLRDFDPETVTRRFNGLNIPLGPLGPAGVTWSTLETHVAEAGMRNQVELLTDLLAESQTGLLITLDEIHQQQTTELREIATVVQHAFRENRQLAFVGAGLAAAVSDVLNDQVLTFLRRAERHHLGPVRRADVRLAIRNPIEHSGRTIGDRALELMTTGTDGYPFLIQLVGAQTWRLHPDETEISVGDAQEGVERARRRLGSLVHEPALASASAIDKSFLLAMAQDDGPSKMSDVQERLGVDVNYTSQYRLRLIAAELIESKNYGYVEFALPYLREFLRNEAASEI